ncbi:MAG TPA: hypothetical protein VN937_26750 [Blastocatellia bacterium]|nr:hypothetical protein [Blastocatellia bacterium]
MSKSFMTGFVVSGMLAIVVGFGAASWQQKDNQLDRYQKELVDATPDEVTEAARQNPNRSAFNGFRSDASEQTISELVTPYRGQRIVLGLNVMTRRMTEFNGSETAESYVGEFSRQSDVVIRGQVASKISQVTEDGKFVFTVYSVSVMEIFKNREMEPVSTGSIIGVTCPGGKVLIDSVIVKAGGNSIATLPPNRELVLFLKFDPASQEYKLTRYNGAFEIEGESVKSLAGRFPPNLLGTKGSFLSTTRRVSKQ